MGFELLDTMSCEHATNPRSKHSFLARDVLCVDKTSMSADDRPQMEASIDHLCSIVPHLFWNLRNFEREQALCTTRLVADK